MTKLTHNKEYSDLPKDNNNFYRNFLLRYESHVFKEKHYSNTDFVYKVSEDIDKITISYLSIERVYRNCEHDYLSAENIILVLDKDAKDTLNISESKLCTKRGDLILINNVCVYSEIAKESSISHIFTNEKVTTCLFEYSYMLPYDDIEDEAMYEVINDKVDYSIIIKSEEIMFTLSIQSKQHPKIKKDSQVLTYDELSKLIGLMSIVEYSANRDRKLVNNLVIDEKYITDMNSHPELIKKFLDFDTCHINQWLSLIEIEKLY